MTKTTLGYLTTWHLGHSLLGCRIISTATRYGACSREYYYEYPSKPEHWSRTLCRAFLSGISSIMVAFYSHTCYLFCCSRPGPLDIKNALQSVLVPKLFLVSESKDSRVVGQHLPKYLSTSRVPLATAQWIPSHSASYCQLCRTTLVWRSSLDILCRTTEQVGNLELSYSGDVGFGLMHGLGARLAMLDRHGWQKRVVHQPPTGAPPFA